MQSVRDILKSVVNSVLGSIRTTERNDFLPKYINSATTTVVKSGAGYVKNIYVYGGTMGNVTIYDNTAASGTILLPTHTVTAGRILLQDINFTTGLTIVTAAATGLIISYR